MKKAALTIFLLWWSALLILGIYLTTQAV